MHKMTAVFCILFTCLTANAEALSPAYPQEPVCDITNWAWTCPNSPWLKEPPEKILENLKLKFRELKVEWHFGETKIVSAYPGPTASGHTGEDNSITLNLFYIRSPFALETIAAHENGHAALNDLIFSHIQESFEVKQKFKLNEFLIKGEIHPKVLQTLGLVKAKQIIDAYYSYHGSYSNKPIMFVHETFATLAQYDFARAQGLQDCDDSMKLIMFPDGERFNGYSIQFYLNIAKRDLERYKAEDDPYHLTEAIEQTVARASQVENKVDRCVVPGK